MLLPRHLTYSENIALQYFQPSGKLRLRILESEELLQGCVVYLKLKLLLMESGVKISSTFNYC